MLDVSVPKHGRNSRCERQSVFVSHQAKDLLMYKCSTREQGWYENARRCLCHKYVTNNYVRGPHSSLVA